VDSNDTRKRDEVDVNAELAENKAGNMVDFSKLRAQVRNRSSFHPISL